MWWHRAPTASIDALPERLRAQAGPRVGVVMLVRYVESPVGPYAEIAASPRLLRPDVGVGLARGHVPFLAVDSLASIAGGRAGWALPKTIGWFDGSAGRAPVRAEGIGWWLRGEAHDEGRAVPGRFRFAFAQADGDGAVHATRVRARGRVRRARVEVDIDRHSGLAQWLRPGWHRGVTFSGRLRIEAPQCTSPPPSR